MKDRVAQKNPRKRQHITKKENNRAVSGSQTNYFFKQVFKR